eukprot:2849561-Alexandrium_andersonii.AAC.1
MRAPTRTPGTLRPDKRILLPRPAARPGLRRQPLMVRPPPPRSQRRAVTRTAHGQTERRRDRA